VLALCGGFEQEFALRQNDTLRTIISWEGRRRPTKPYLLEERLPGQRQPVKAASRKAGRGTRQPHMGKFVNAVLSSFLTGNSPARWEAATFFVPDL